MLGISILIGLISLKIWLRSKQDKELGKKSFDLVSNSLFWGFSIWKFSLILFEPKLVMKSPLSLLYFTGGDQGFLLGIVVAFIYYLFKVGKEKVPFDAILVFSFTTLGVYHIFALFILKGNFPFHLILGLYSFLLLIFFYRMIAVKKPFYMISLMGILVMGMFIPSGKLPPVKDEATIGKIGTSEGNFAPEISLKNLDSMQIKLSDYKGKKVVLNFWATWCPPCKAEMPHMEDFYVDQHKNGVEIISVNLSSSEKSIGEVKKFVKNHNLTFPVLLDVNGEVGDQFKAITIPTTYVIDSQGVIQKKIIGPMDKNMLVEMMKGVN